MGLSFVAKSSRGLSKQDVPVSISTDQKGGIRFSLDAVTFRQIGAPAYVTGAYENGRIYLKEADDRVGFKARRYAGYRYFWRFPGRLVEPFTTVKAIVGQYKVAYDKEYGLWYVDVNNGQYHA